MCGTFPRVIIAYLQAQRLKSNVVCVSVHNLCIPLKYVRRTYLPPEEFNIRSIQTCIKLNQYKIITITILVHTPSVDC